MRGHLFHVALGVERFHRNHALEVGERHVFRGVMLFNVGHDFAAARLGDFLPRRLIMHFHIFQQAEHLGRLAGINLTSVWNIIDR